MSFHSVRARQTMVGFRLPIVVLLMVILPVWLLIGLFGDRSIAQAQGCTIPGGCSPLPTPTATWIPIATATPTPIYIPPTATRIYPTPIKKMPTPTATSLPGSVTANGYSLRKVIGDRLSSVIYGYTNDGWLFRSPDDGRTWNLVMTKPQVGDFVMSPVAPDTLYSGIGQDCSQNDSVSTPFFISTNGGIDFDEIASGRNLRPLLAHGADDQILFTADCIGPYITVDGGLTWIEKMDDPEFSPWGEFVAMQMATAYFTGEPKPDEPNWDHLYALGANLDGTNIVVYSNDSGATWQRISPPEDPMPAKVTALAVDPNKVGALWVADVQGIWSTQDNGKSWALAFAGLEAVRDETGAGSELRINDVIFHPNGRLYLATANGLYGKRARDEAWRKIEGGAFDNAEIYNIHFTDSSPKALWLNTENGVFVYQIP